MTAVPLNTDSVCSLIELLKRQVGVLEQLTDQANLQSVAVAEGRTESLLSLLAQRQQAIDQLQQINGDLSPFRDDWNRIWSALNETQKAQVAPLVQKVHQLLDHALTNDERDRQKLEVAKNQVAADLARLTHTGEATAAYQRAGIATYQNRFTNRQG